MQSGTWRTRGIAWGAVMVWHLLAGWWLLHAVPSARHTNRDGVLRIVYVPLSLPSPPPPPSPPMRVVQSSQPVREAAAKPRQLPAKATATSPADPLIVSPSSRSLLDQTLATGQQRNDAASGFRNDPFADRPARLPAADANRFKMRDPLTPERVLAWVGQHVNAPAGYEKDPCPRNKRNIAGMLAQGDSSQLQMDLEFERRHCRP